MSNVPSHILSTHGGAYLGLTFVAGSGITYSETNPTQFEGKAVQISANRTVVLVPTGGRIDGVIKKVEPTDGTSVKLTVQVCGALAFRNEVGTAAVTGYGTGLIGGAVAGEVADAAADADSRGKITSQEDGYIVAIF